MVAHSTEFENIIVRDEEQSELEAMVRMSCPIEVKGGPSSKYGKISILIQVKVPTICNALCFSQFEFMRSLF